MSRIQRSSLNVVSSAVGYMIPMLVNLVTTPLLLRGLGEAAYGIQSLVAVIIGYLTFMDMGLDLPITKLLAEDRARQDVDSENKLLSTTLILYSIIGLLGMAAIVLLSDWFIHSIFKVPDDLTNQAIVVFKLAGLGFLGSVGMSWGRAVAMGLHRFDISYSVSVLLSTIGTFLGLTIVYAGYGVVGYVLTRTLFTLLAGPMYFFLTRSLLPEFKFQWGIHRGTLGRVAGYLGYGTFNRLTSSLVSRLDQTLLGVWTGVAAAGIYAVPFLLMNSLNYMLAYMLGFIFPMASELQSQGLMDQLRHIFIRSSRFIAALAGMVFVPLYILGDLFLDLWTPTISSQATGVLKLLALTGYITTLTATLPNNVMVGLGNMKQFTVYTTLRAVAIALFCFLWIRPFGIEGAGMALLSSCIVDIAYLIVFLRRYIQIPVMGFLVKAYGRPVALTVLFIPLTYMARPLAGSWFGFCVIGVGLLFTYTAAGFFMGVFGGAEKEAIKTVVGVIKKSFSVS